MAGTKTFPFKRNRQETTPKYGLEIVQIGH